ncbi:putative aquaporin-12B isoform X3 [Macaca mulatta]
MAGLNVSLSFFFATFALCEGARRASKALLPVGAYEGLAREVVGAVQLGACCLEMRMLVELGPWAGGFGPDLLLTLLFLLFLAHGATLDGDLANPTVSLQEFLMAEASLPGTLLKLAAQGLGMQAACTLTHLCWAWELSDLHLLQSLMAQSCSSALRTSVPHGALVEAICAFCFHLILLHLRHSPPAYRVPAVALLVTVTAYTGMVLAVLLHQGRLPRLFQRNLFYSQKNKYRAPRGKPALASGDTQTPAKGSSGREPGRQC